MDDKTKVLTDTLYIAVDGKDADSFFDVRQEDESTDDMVTVGESAVVGVYKLVKKVKLTGKVETKDL